MQETSPQRMGKDWVADREEEAGKARENEGKGMILELESICFCLLSQSFYPMPYVIRDRIILTSSSTLPLRSFPAFFWSFFLFPTPCLSILYFITPNWPLNHLLFKQFLLETSSHISASLDSKRFDASSFSGSCVRHVRCVIERFNDQTVTSLFPGGVWQR